MGYNTNDDEFFKQERKRINHYLARSIINFIILWLVILVALTMLIAPAIMKVSNMQQYTVTVQSKERTGGDKGKYLVYCLDAEGNSKVFEVTDSLFKLRFDSADTYNLIQENTTYTFTAGGYRIPFFSMYPNIYEMTKEDSSDGSSKS